MLTLLITFLYTQDRAVAFSLRLRGVFPGQSAVFRALRLVTGNSGDSVEVAAISVVTPGGAVVPAEEFLAATMAGEAVA